MKKMRLAATIGWILILATFFISCSITPELTKEEQKLLHEPVTAYQKTSPYKQALSKMGEMLNKYAFPPTVIQVKNTMNKTACQQNLPIEITDMIKTALNEIGGNVEFADYDPKYEYHKHGSKYTSYGYNAVMKQYLPEVFISGAITECDENLDSKSSGASGYITVGGGTSMTDVDAGVDKTVNYSRLALDLHLIDYKTNKSIPRKQTELAVDVWDLQKGRNFGFAIYGCGMGIDGQRRVTQGKHNAVRSMVELSILQLIGRHLQIPYWICIPGTSQDPDVIGWMKRDFRELKLAERVGLIQHLLARCGYHVSMNGILDKATENSVRDFRSNKKRGSEKIDENLYVDLMLYIPTSRHVKAYVPEKSVSIQAASAYRTGGQGPARPLKDGSVLRSGDSYKISVKPDMDCYLYVFQADSSGQLFQLFPLDTFNGVPLHIYNPLARKKQYIIPAPDKSFVLDNRAGRERIYIIASVDRNPELERLCSELKNTQDTDREGRANDNLQQYLAQRQQVATAADSQKTPISWQETGDMFSVMSQRLERLSKETVYVMEFNHR